MRQARFDLKVDWTATRNRLRPAVAVVTGVVALAIGAFVLVAERSGRGSDGSGPAHSRIVPSVSTPGESAAANTNPTDMHVAKPKFERSDEPAYEDSVLAHGG
jgi:hypothetical protein